ncbi:FAD-binding oxidoreductase [Nocardioides panacisoli]|uniref:FAD-binding oxidoreductase n=1 Tax=Nocardioides panacisoli TaxID=627624 RepID=A0ABP7IRT9_9ACTN
MTIERELLPTTTTDTVAAGHALRGLLGDRVVLPGDAAYDQARTPWNFAVDQRPAAVVVPRSAAEVATVVRMAAETGLRVAPQSTGHNAGPLAAQGLDDVVVVRLHDMTMAVADPVRGIVRVEGGATWEPAVLAAAAHGKAVLHGSSPDVGIAGYSLGGGIGWYARKLGLATNSLTAVELVIADGTLVRADATHNAELFWALRGGGGSFGVVTALEFKMYDVPDAYAGFLIWDLADVEPVLREWAAWAPHAPEDITTSFRAMRLPDMPDIPEGMRGRRIAIIDGAVLGSDERGAELLAGLRALEPEIDTFGRMPAPALTRIHMDPEGGAPFQSDAAMLDAFPSAAIDAFLGQVGPDAESSLLLAELRQLGGALGRPHPGGGVLAQLDAQFVAFAGGMAATPEMGAAAHRDAVRLTDALAPWANGRHYLNFSENQVDTRSAYAPRAWRQLTGIRSAVDPHGLFAANHPVPRLFENGEATS